MKHFIFEEITPALEALCSKEVLKECVGKTDDEDIVMVSTQDGVIFDIDWYWSGEWESLGGLDELMEELNVH